MAHRFVIEEITLEAGLGVATRDRVRNQRTHVSSKRQTFTKFSRNPR